MRYKIDRNSKNWEIFREARNLAMIVAAAALLAFNIKSLVHARNLFPGGITGMTVLLQQIANKYYGIALPFTPINIFLNAIPVYIGFRYIGKRFTMHSCLMIMLTSILTDIMPTMPITYDILLISIFGGIINGFVISVCLFADATSGGLDFVSIFFSEKYGIDAWNYILLINAIILGIAGALFGWEQALYSVIFQMISTQILHMSYKHYQKNTLMIITKYPDEIAKIIVKCTNHGSTSFEGVGTFQKEERQMIYSVVSSDEVRRIISEIHKVDEEAFINVLKTESVYGRFYQKPKE